MAVNDGDTRSGFAQAWLLLKEGSCFWSFPFKPELNPQLSPLNETHDIKTHGLEAFSVFHEYVLCVTEAFKSVLGNDKRFLSKTLLFPFERV